MTAIYLIRHGQASFDSDDYDKLSDTGKIQASLLSKCLENKQLKPDIIITGSMHRHKQTAKYSLVHTDNPQSITIEDKRWNEYDHQNILAIYKPEFKTPKSMRNYLSKQPQPMLAFRQHFIGAINAWMASDEKCKNNQKYTESWPNFVQRVTSALNELAQLHKGKNIIVYTSGGPISVVITHLLGLVATQSIQINWSLVNAGLTKIITRNNHLTLSTLNEHDIFEQQTNKALITYT